MSGINSEQHDAFHRAMLTLRDAIASGDFNKGGWMQDEATVRSLWLAASSVNYKLTDYVKEHERYPWDKVPIATDAPPAVFCSMLSGDIVPYDHISIHIEMASCVNPVSAYEAMKPTSQELAAEIAKLYKYDAEHGDEIAKRVHEMRTDADRPVQS